MMMHFLGWLSSKPQHYHFKSKMFVPHLEEVDLHSSVAEVQHDGALCAEPVAKVRQSGELIAVPGSDVCPGFQQVLAHVIPEILEEGNLRRHEEILTRNQRS